MKNWQLVYCKPMKMKMTLISKYNDWEESAISVLETSENENNKNSWLIFEILR